MQIGGNRPFVASPGAQAFGPVIFTQIVEGIIVRETFYVQNSRNTSHADRQS